MRSKSFLIAVIVVLMTLASAACQPKVTPTDTIPAPIPSPTGLPDSGLAVNDDGSPLAPQVIERVPAGGQQANRDGSLALVFDQPMDQNSTALALVVTDSAGSPVSGKVSWPTQNKLEFKPDQPLAVGQKYLALLSEAALSASGKALLERYSFSFETAPSLAVSEVLPANGTQEIGLNAGITVIFNRPVVPLVASTDQANLPNPIVINPEVAGKGEWVTSSIFVFTPDLALQGGTNYIVSVPAGLADALGETSLASSYDWNFITTMAGVDSYWFTDYPWESNPNFKESVPLRQSFTIKFRQPMDPPSTESNVFILSDGGQSVPLDYAWFERNTQLVITPTQNMEIGSGYSLRVDRNALVAGGGTGLGKEVIYHFQTVLYPGVKFTDPANGVVEQAFSGSFAIHFISPMKFGTWVDHIRITPSPSKPVEWWYSGDYFYSNHFTLTTWGLDASTNYTIEILPGMEDLYGNVTTGTTVVNFTTAAHPPSAYLQMPQGLSLYRLDGEHSFYANFRNISNATLRLYRLSAKTYSQFQNYNSGLNEWSFTPDNQDLVWTETSVVSGGLNERILKKYTPTENGQPLQPGLYFLALNSPDVPTFGTPFNDHRIILLAGSNVTLKSSSTEALAWVTNLTSGKPVANVPVVLYDYLMQEVGRTSTDQNGLAYFTGLTRGQEYYQTFFAITEDQVNYGLSAANWSSGISNYNYGIWEDFYTRPGQSRAYVYTDRPLYRPGQPVYFKGIVREDDDGSYRVPGRSQVRVAITSYEGQQVFEQNFALNANGSFEGSITLDQEAALGSYSIAVSYETEEITIGTVDFGVAEYKKPEFIVDIAPSPDNATPNSTINFAIQSDYYSGGPLVNADVTWTLQAMPFSFTPPSEFSAYSFSDQEWDMGWFDHFGIGQGEFIADGSTVTSSAGQAVVSVPAILDDKGNSRTLILEAGVTDFAGVSVYSRAETVVHRSMVYPGIRSSDYVGEINKPLTLDLAALDWDGKPLAGQSLAVEVVERRWNSAQVIDDAGRVVWKSTVEEIPVTVFSNLTTDAQGKVQVNFTPDRGGVFTARITAKDNLGNTGLAATYFWVSSSDFIPWRQNNDKSFDLVKDKTEYLPGDTAEILIASPFNDLAYALVTVERMHIRKYEVIPLVTNSTIYRLPITSDMAPNVYVSVVVIKSARGGVPDFRTSITELKVARNKQTLKVTLTPDRLVSAPGEVVNYTIKTTDLSGTPVSSEVSIGVSDLAALNLAAPNSSPILDFFYFERNLGVSTSVPLVYTIEDYNVEIAAEESADGLGMGSGGGKGAGEVGVIPVRGNFLDTAFWSAQVGTDANGLASVTFPLPDNLTTWRMDARAVTADTRVGQGQVDLVSTRPLLVRPQTPRFFTAGDEATIGTAVQNNTGQDLQVTVKLAASGLMVLDAPTADITLPNGGQVYVTWRVQVPLDSTRVDLTFSASGGEFSDASLPPLGTLDGQGIPVYRYEVPETVGTSGLIPSGSTAVEGILLPQGWNTAQGSLDIRIAHSLAAGMTDGLKYLENTPYDGIEFTISSFLPNVVTTRAMRLAGIVDPDLDANLLEQVTASLQRINSQQHADGGWGWWGEEKSDPLTSAYAVFALVEANESGYSVDQNVLSRGVSYLAGQLRSYTGMVETSLLNRQAFILYVLARAGQPSPSNTVQLYDRRLDLDLYARAYLAETLWMIDRNDSRLQVLLSDFQSAAITSGTGTHWEEKTADWFNWNSDIRTTAIVLSALSQIDTTNPLNANAVRWLMSHRDTSNLAWSSTQETAWTLIALTRWMVASGELQAQYDYGIAVNGTRIGGGTANAATLRLVNEMRLDISQLLSDQINRLAIARSSGPGVMYYTAHLNVFLPVEQVGPLDNGIQVKREYFLQDDPANAITEASQGDLLLVRLTVSSVGTLHNVIVNDPLPAGLEAVDTSLKTSPDPIIPENYNPARMWWEGWGWWNFDHAQMRDESVVLSADYLPAGSYVYTYVARASTPGTFRVIPASAHEAYFPEVYGRSGGSLFIVTP